MVHICGGAQWEKVKVGDRPQGGDGGLGDGAGEVGDGANDPGALHYVF